jgi:hypothetical protein
MKRIRIIREPEEKHIATLGAKRGKRESWDYILTLAKGVEMRVPDEIADLLTATRCPKCCIVYLLPGSTVCWNCGGRRIHGLAEEVKEDR